MSVKRGRNDRSSSCAKAAVATAGSAKVMKIGAVAETSRPYSMTIDFPVKFGGYGDLKTDGFLERCHHCKKRIAQNKEVFMYGDLCAFCSTECRYYQIARDQLAMKRQYIS